MHGPAAVSPGHPSDDCWKGAPMSWTPIKHAPINRARLTRTTLRAARRSCAALAVAAALVGVPALAGLSAPTAQAAAAPAEGHDYVLLQHPLTGHPQQVVEVFSYDCAHSYQMEAALDAWAARQRPALTVERIPAAWPDTPALLAYARLYYALDRMGVAQQLALKVFHTVRDERRPLTTEEAAAEWAGSAGLDEQAFRTAYESPEVQRQAQNAPALRERYEVHEMPSFVIGGRYRTSPFLASGGVAGTLPVVSYLYQRSSGHTAVAPDAVQNLPAGVPGDALTGTDGGTEGPDGFRPNGPEDRPEGGYLR